MAEDFTFTMDELRGRIERGWDDFNAYIGTLSEAQLTTRTDAAGWTIKDHIMHLAVWEDGICALLDGQPRGARMGLEDEVWLSGDYDAMNAVIQQRYKDRSQADVRAAFQAIHDRLMTRLQSMTEADLRLPYRHYQPSSSNERPVVGWVMGNTFEHYAEHQPWIAAIAAGS